MRERTHWVHTPSNLLLKLAIFTLSLVPRVTDLFDECWLHARKHLHTPINLLLNMLFFLGASTTSDRPAPLPTIAAKTVSPWHEIPLFTGDGDNLHYICEIPKETSAKMEVATVSNHSAGKEQGGQILAGLRYTIGRSHRNIKSSLVSPPLPCCMH